MSSERSTILFVDDEERILRSLRMLCRSHHDVLITTSGHEALEIVRARPVHVIVSDQRMPEVSGVELLRRVRDASPQTMRLLLTGYADLQAIVASVNDGEIFRFVEKPWQPQYLLGVVGQAAKIAVKGFARGSEVAVPPLAATPAVTPLKLLVIDEDAATFQLVRELASEQHDVRHADTIEAALAILSENDVAIVVAELSHRRDDVAGALKTLKHYSPATLTIATSPLRDSRSLIDLINQGQIYRFLPKPLSRELLRRGLQAACTHHARLRAAPALVQRHVVEQARFEPMSISARLLDYWRRIRDNGRARQVA
jgi:response regulator RpfG family c-di-GMP phosphodiesterase